MLSPFHRVASPLRRLLTAIPPLAAFASLPPLLALLLLWALPTSCRGPPSGSPREGDVVEGSPARASALVGELPFEDPAAEPMGPPRVLYVGSSTVANFLEEAEPVYGRLRFLLDTAPESAGGERAIQDGNADLAGIACEPSAHTRDLGIQATLIGTDTIAVIVNTANAVATLRSSDLRRIYRGEVTSWKELGGPDLPIRRLVVAPESATRTVFQQLILEGDEYGETQVVSPDASMPMKIEEDRAAIGFISHSFLCSGGSVRVLSIDGQAPLPENLHYPIVRPLYLLWRPETPHVAEFIAWTSTSAAEEILIKCFGRPRSLPRLLHAGWRD